MKYERSEISSPLSPPTSKSPLAFIFAALALFVATSWLLVWTASAQDRAFDWGRADVGPLAPGINRAHVQSETPRRLNINCVRVDTATKGISFYTTPRAKKWTSDKEETIRQTTRDFVRAAHEARRNMVAAINADAFSPWPAPWDQATPTNLRGLAISKGRIVSQPSGTPSLLVRNDGRLEMTITDGNTDVHGVLVAVSGFGYCIENGVPVASDDVKHPRTGYGLSEDRRFLFLMTIDGRRHASLGCTIAEAGEWLRHFGAYTGINMDGGGSTTLVRWDPKTKSAELLNQPVGNGQTWHDKDPALEQQNYRPTERANGNNFGVIVANR